MSIYRYIHPHIQAAIAVIFTIFLMLFGVCNLKRLHKLKLLALLTVMLGTLASASLSLAEYYGWPCEERLLLFCFIFYGLSLLFACWHEYRYGSRERRTAVTLDLIILAIPIAILLGVYLFALWRRAY